jgi:hypothetical protein
VRNAVKKLSLTPYVKGFVVGIAGIDGITGDTIR